MTDIHVHSSLTVP